MKNGSGLEWFISYIKILNIHGTEINMTAWEIGLFYVDVGTNLLNVSEAESCEKANCALSLNFVIVWSATWINPEKSRGNSCCHYWTVLRINILAKNISCEILIELCALTLTTLPFRIWRTAWRNLVFYTLRAHWKNVLYRFLFVAMLIAENQWVHLESFQFMWFWQERFFRRTFYFRCYFVFNPALSAYNTW